MGPRRPSISPFKRRNSAALSDPTHTEVRRSEEARGNSSFTCHRHMAYLELALPRDIPAARRPWEHVELVWRREC